MIIGPVAFLEFRQIGCILQKTTGIANSNVGYGNCGYECVHCRKRALI
jgi:hypothetical protein